MLLCLVLFSASRAAAQEPWPLRISGSADWGIVKSDSTLDGVGESTTLIQQKYSMDLSGFVWDPRFSLYSIGLDLTDSSQEDGSFDQESRGVGYRAQASFFPGRPFPLTLFARRSITDASGGNVARADRETDSWGARFALVGGTRQSFDLQYDRSRFDLVSQLGLRERRANGTMNYTLRQEEGELRLRYGYLDRAERNSGTQFTRNNLSLSERTRIGEITTFSVSGQHTSSDARFSSGDSDELRINRLATSFDFNPASGRDSFVGYDFADNNGRFVDSTSHALRTRTRFPMGKRWSSTLGAQAGILESRGATSDTEQVRAGANGGVRYNREWSRVSFTTGYGVGFARERFSNSPTNTRTSYSSDVGARFQLTSRSNLGASVLYRTDETDQTGVGFSNDELRGSLRWTVKLGARWDFTSDLTRRHLKRETFAFGILESDETSVNVTLGHRLAGLTLAWVHIEGVSEVLPDPATATPFTPGADTVAESDTLSLMASWRPTPHLRMSLLTRGVYRDFSNFTENEEYITILPEVHYDRNTWTVSASYTRYERRNGLEYLSDTWSLRIGKRFF